MSNRKQIPTNVERRLYCESMGFCMNPKCKTPLFPENGGDIIEKAHIDSYCDSKDNSFENLVLLCPNCHTNFDKNMAFTKEEVIRWKNIRKEERDALLTKKFRTFDELKEVVVPLLVSNKVNFEQYYLKDNREQWDSIELSILTNNAQLKEILTSNRNLFQSSTQKEWSNLYLLDLFIAHIDEFERTRVDRSKSREILFPEEINAIFGLKDDHDRRLYSNMEHLEALIDKYKKNGEFVKIELGIDYPYIQLNKKGKESILYLDNHPELRQEYKNQSCYTSGEVRVESLNYALKCIKNAGIDFWFTREGNYREICLNGIDMHFVYKYCFSALDLRKLAPKAGTVIVNLHNWNGESCISENAYDIAESMGVQLLTMKGFYEFVRKAQYSIN